MRVAVVFATLGRADTVATALALVAKQTRPPDQIIISAVTPADVPALAQQDGVDVVFGAKGLPAQRNTGLKAVASGTDIVVFFDDDFAPAPAFLENLEAIFNSDSEIVGVTGSVVADGIGGPGYTFDDAQKLLLEAPRRTLATSHTRRVKSLYGCNMAVRTAAAVGLVFDEVLPLYAWQEDVDYSTQLGRRGKLVWSDALEGVHLGVKRARTPGRPLGYAQIANPIFLRRKRTMGLSHAYSLMARNVAANLVRSIRPEPWCDRRGRLAGNLRALGDFFAGKLHPSNMLLLK